jgi:hypothetical protein
MHGDPSKKCGEVIHLIDVGALNIIFIDKNTHSAIH